MCDLLFGMVDVCDFLLIILPLYPKTVEGFIYSVNLFAYTETTALNRMIYWGMCVSLIVCGVIKVFIVKRKAEKGCKILTDISIAVHVLAVLFLAMAKEPYAVTVTFLLLVIKVTLLLQASRR